MYVCLGKEDVDHGKWRVERDPLDGGAVMRHGLVEVTPTIKNFHARQRPGTTLVDVQYDITGATRSLNITLEVAGKDGVRRSITPAALAGSVGNGVAPGSNLSIVWDTAKEGGEVFGSEEVIVVGNGCPQPAGMVFIPSGAFRMGLPNQAKTRSVLVNGFYMAQYETTNELWDQVSSWATFHGYLGISRGVGFSCNRKGRLHPVASVSWIEVLAWCNARSEMEGLKPCYTILGEVFRGDSILANNLESITCDWNANGYRLPTEAEWEKAARGGLVNKLYPWGDTISHAEANFMSAANLTHDSREGQLHGDLSETRGCHPSYTAPMEPFTSPVGSFLPNSFGLYDTAGNVGEWCWDVYEDYPSEDQANPQGPAGGDLHVVRGGGWSRSAKFQRCGDRVGWYAKIGSHPKRMDFGFRLARSRL